MAIRAEVSAEVSAAARERLTGLGLTLVEESVESPWLVTGPAVGTYRYDAGPVVLQVIPASAAPLRGPVALLSPPAPAPAWRHTSQRAWPRPLAAE